MDYYQILQLSKEATPDDIKQAYRRLALLYHPDKNGGDEEQFKRLHAAYQILRDPVTRKEYDESIEQNKPYDNFQMYMDFFDAMVSPLLSKWKDIMENKKVHENEILQKNAKNNKNTHEKCEKTQNFQENQKSHKRAKMQKNTIRLKLVVELKDLYEGSTKKVVYKIQTLSGVCTKHVFVDLCSGKREFVYPGEGDEIEPGVYGDVCVYLEIERHDILTISPTNPYDLHMIYPISLYELYFGIDEEIQYFGESIQLKKAWFQQKGLSLPDDHTDMVLEMVDRGLPYEEGEDGEIRYGTLFVFFKLRLPRLPKQLLNSYEFKSGIKRYFKHNEH